MASKLNIFNALPHHASDDEDDDKKTGQSGSQAKKDRVRNRGKKQETPETKTVGKETAGGRLDHHLKARDHQLKKISKDLDHPHTLERKSGTGEQAFGNKEKKGGAGRFNKGNFKDDFKNTKEGGEREEGSDEESPKEEEDRTVTWDEYSQQAGTGSKQAVNDTKLKITEDQLKKELGKATLLEKKEKEINEHTETRKKNKGANVVGMNTEHAELLGFRTGFKIYDDSKKRQQRRPEDKQGDKPEQKEGEATQAAETKTEEKKEEKAPEDTKQNEESPSGQRGAYKGSRRGGKGYGGYEDKGERGGYKGGYKGENRGGYKGEGYKGEGQKEGGYKEGGYKGGYKEGGNKEGGYKGGYKGKGEKVTFNAEDESLFPKLG